MSNQHTCRHVKSGTLPATTTLHHRAIIGATRADDLDEVTHLCGICSGVMVAFLQFLEADDAMASKEALYKLLGATKN